MYYLGEDEASVLRHARARTHTHTHTRTHTHLELEIWKHNTIQDFVYEQQKWKSAQRAHPIHACDEKAKACQKTKTRQAMKKRCFSCCRSGAGGDDRSHR